MCGAALVLFAACTEVSDGAPVAVPGGAANPTEPLPTVPTGPNPSSPGTAEPAPGILPTQRNPLPANTVTCTPEAKPTVSVAASVADPAAPRVTVGVPDGWSFTAGAGDMAVTMQGPAGMTAAVSIAPTALDPDAAFREYTDGVMERSAMTTVSIQPAQLCGYSGQALTGTWSDGPDDAVEFVDRIVHVWTNDDDFLLVIHVEGPAGEFDAAAASTITDAVEVTIP